MHPHDTTMVHEPLEPWQPNEVVYISRGIAPAVRLTDEEIGRAHVLCITTEEERVAGRAPMHLFAADVEQLELACRRWLAAEDARDGR